MIQASNINILILLHTVCLQEHNAKKKPTVASKESAPSSKKPRKEKGASTLGRPPGIAPKKLSGSTSSSALHNYGSEEHASKAPADSVGRNGRDSEIMSDPLGDSIEEDDLFFSNESFDDLRAQAAENGTSDASGTSHSISPTHLLQTCPSLVDRSPLH